MNAKYILIEENLLKKAATIKRFEKTVNVETKKQYQKLHVIYDFDKII